MNLGCICHAGNLVRENSEFAFKTKPITHVIACSKSESHSGVQFYFAAGRDRAKKFIQLDVFRNVAAGICFEIETISAATSRQRRKKQRRTANQQTHHSEQQIL